MLNRRKDNKGRVLREGESQRKNGGYDFRWRDYKGKRHSVYAKTLTELREKEEAINKNMYDGIKIEAKTLTLNDLFNTWNETKRGLKDNTFTNYQYMYKHFVSNSIGKMIIETIKPTDIKKFYISLIENDGLKISTVDTIHTVLHQVLDLGVRDDYIRKNPSDGAMRELKLIYNNGKKERKALSREEQLLLMNFLENSNVYNQWLPLFTVMFETGMRIGEVTGLRWKDINLDDNTININHTLVYYSKGDNPNTDKKCSYAINTPKTKNSNRTIPMTQAVKESFKAEKERQDSIGLTCRSNIEGYTDFIFLNRFGEVFNNSVINKVIGRIVRDCNFHVLEERLSEDVVLLPKFSCHWTRHTFATRLVEAGVNVKVAQSILGHSDISITMDIYAEVLPDVKKQEMEKLDEYLKLD